jgi:hypothetical protein
MNKPEIIKLVQHQIIDEIEKNKIDSVNAVARARNLFHGAVKAHIMTCSAGLIDELLQTTGGCREKVVAEIKYELTDDQLDRPDDICHVVLRDGTDYDCTFRIAMPVRVVEDGTLVSTRRAWVLARRRAIGAAQLQTRMVDAQKPAWARVIGRMLETTKAGAALMRAAEMLRAELREMGWDRVAEDLGVEVDSTESAPCENTKTESSN